MELTTKQETVYGGPLVGRKAKQWFVYLRGDRIGNGASKEEAQAKAKQTLSDAYTYLTQPAIARVAIDGSVIVFRQIAPDSAMYEFCRDGKRGSGSCLGRMTSVDITFSSLAEYADYVMSNYNSNTCIDDALESGVFTTEGEV